MVNEIFIQKIVKEMKIRGSKYLYEKRNNQFNKSKHIYSLLNKFDPHHVGGGEPENLQ